VVDVALSLLILAQDRAEQQPPDPSTGIPLIVIALLFAALVGATILLLFHRRSKASKGGVEPPPADRGEPHPGQPPVESVEPRS